MNYEEALEYIHSISWTFCKPGLERISELCRSLGNPEKKLKFVHVAGTNGKVFNIINMVTYINIVNENLA